MNEQTYTFVAWLAYYLCLIFCILYSISAIKKKKLFSKDIFVLLSLILVLNSMFINNSPFLFITNIGSIVLIISIIFIILKDIKQTNMLVNELKQKAVLLENEMIKKSIQPHFLLNTLTVISEWIETKPEIALEQIKLLSNEFRYIINATKKKFVTVNQEIDLCQNYLQMFNMKQERNFILVTEIQEKGYKIPPLIFHTIIENSVIHAPDNGSEQFKIEERSTKNGKIYKLTSPGSNKSESSSEGLGLNYIKSRLELSFPSKWTYKDYLEDSFWITEIGINK